jgi:hypothetical protein
MPWRYPPQRAAPRPFLQASGGDRRCGGTRDIVDGAPRLWKHVFNVIDPVAALPRRRRLHLTPKDADTDVIARHPHPAPVLPGRPRASPHLRRLRRASRPLRLHRHLRAGPSRGRRGRLPHRRAGPDPRARRELRALSRRQLRLRLPLGGRRGTGRGAPRPPRPRLALHRAQHRRPRRVHDLGRQGGGRADVRGEPRHPRHRGGPGRAPVRELPAGHRLLGPARRERSPRAVRHPHVVPGQRDGRPLAGRAQDRRGVRAGRHRGRAPDAPGGPRARADRLRLLELLHGDLRRPGRTPS